MDLEAEFRKYMGLAGTASEVVADEPMTIEKLRAAMELVGSPPPALRPSHHAPVFMEARPQARPLTDDMRSMCDDIGPQKVPAAFQFSHVDIFGRRRDVVVFNPVHTKEGDV